MNDTHPRGDMKLRAQAPSGMWGPCNSSQQTVKEKSNPHERGIWMKELDIQFWTRVSKKDTMDGRTDQRIEGWMDGRKEGRKEGGYVLKNRCLYPVSGIVETKSKQATNQSLKPRWCPERGGIQKSGTRFIFPVGFDWWPR